MTNAFFFQTQQIPDNTILFTEFQQQNIFFSYFQVDQNYYLFLYAQKSIQIDFLYQEIDVIQELDSKQRKIRSLRGFFLYGLEIIENGKDYEILETNLQPFFWRKVKNIIRQNKKAALHEFLFGLYNDRSDSCQGSNPQLEDQIAALQNQVNSLQDRIRDLETTRENSKYALSPTLKAPDATKNIQQGDPNSKSEKGPYELSNHGKGNLEIKEPENLDSKSLSEDSKIPLKALSTSQQHNIPSNEDKGLSEATQRGNQTIPSGNVPSLRSEDNFVGDVWQSPGNLSEQEKIEIIKTGFQRQAENKISLKKYYESTDPYSLFQSKGYSIKYETVRGTKLYQNLND